MSTVALSLALLAASSSPETLALPEGFSWCVGISSHQHEGMNVHSDWWRFEREHPDRAASSGRAVDHWNHVEDDLDRAVAVGADTFRFTIEWARVEPEQGRWDLDVVAHYREEIAALRARGLRPLIALNAVTLPAWFEDKGGWTWPGAPEAFTRYALKATEVIGPDVEDWATSIDAMVHVLSGYVYGLAPPLNKHGLGAIEAPLLGILRAHAAAYRSIKRARKRRGAPTRVGVIHHVQDYRPEGVWNPLDHGLALAVAQVVNWAMSDAIRDGRVRIFMPPLLVIDEEVPGLKGTQDFIGLNYFTREYVGLDGLLGGMDDMVDRQLELDSRRWASHPEGLEALLLEAARRYPGVPLLVAENGLAEDGDAGRGAYIEDHVAAVARAIDGGAPVEGYCYWSLLDNYEWLHGFGPKFGLYAVDPVTLERRRRPSADVFRRLAAENRVPVRR